MQPNSFDTLAQYCFQQLGAPVIDIHVAEEQAQNRIEDAFDFFQEFHGEATRRVFVKHVVTGDQLTVENASDFSVGEQVVGLTSGATAPIVGLLPHILILGRNDDAFEPGEPIEGDTSGATGECTEYQTGNIEDGFITMDPSIVSVINVFPIAGGANSTSQFSASYQIKVNDIYSMQSSSGSLATGGLAYYEATKEYLNLMDGVFKGETIFRYNAKTRELYLDMSWYDNVNPGDYIMMDCFQIVDPEAYTAIWNDRMLKKLATAYIKKQWGSNMKLHSGIVLPGGITINGQAIYDEAMDEIDKIENLIRDTYQEPCGFLVG